MNFILITMKKVMKAIAAIMLMTAVVFTAGCTKDDGGSLKGTTWQLDNPHDEAFAQVGDYHVIYTVVFGQNDEVTFTREISCEEYDYYQKPVMTGTYTYNNGSGVAMIHNEGETTDYRITFTVSGDTMTWHWNLRDVILHKQ